MRAKIMRVDIGRRAEMPVAAKTMVSSSMAQCYHQCQYLSYEF